MKNNNHKPGGDTGVARNVDWRGGGEGANWKKIVKLFGGVFRWRNGNVVTEMAS